MNLKFILNFIILFFSIEIFSNVYSFDRKNGSIYDNSLYNKIENNYIESKDYQYLKNKYRWFSNDIYYYVKKYCYANPRIVFSLIHVESSGKRYAKGKKVKVFLIKNGKYVYEYHYAVGLMQVMTFHYSENEDYRNYFSLEKNIQLGCRILNECFFKYKNFVKSISCYNMGINSRKINSNYVRKIIVNL
jgi:soluble lytic murein transglycosylase-like protein